MIFEINRDTKLHDWQVKAICALFKSFRFVITVARQHGKTWLGRQLLLDFLLRYKRRKNPVAVVVMPTVVNAFDLYGKALYDAYLSHLPQSVCWIKGSTSGNCVILYYKRSEGDVASIKFYGVNSNTRGTTADLLIADEVAQFPPSLLHKTYFPMLDATSGKAYITSTIREDDHYWDLKEGWAKLAKTDKYYGAVEFNLENSGRYDEKWIERKKSEYRATGEWHNFLKEYMNYPYATMAGAAPFSEYLWRMRSMDRWDVTKEMVMRNGFINVSCDIGKPGNFPWWAWFKRGDEVLIYEYGNSDVPILQFPQMISKKFRWLRQVNLFFPNDVRQPSLEKGGTIFDNICTVMNAQRLDKHVNIIDLPQTKNKANLIVSATEGLKSCRFHKMNVHPGLSQLAGTKHPVDSKTNQIRNHKDWVNNGKQHAADAFCYIFAAIDNGLIPPFGRSPESALYPTNYKIFNGRLTYTKKFGKM